MKDFKDYAISTWADKQNEQYLLSLQNQHNVNVIFALWCCWVDKTTQQNAEECLGLCENFTNEHIIPLRNKRKSLEKETPEYNNILQNEIAKEFELIDIIQNKYNQSGDIPAKDFFAGIYKLELNI